MAKAPNPNGIVAAKAPNSHGTILSNANGIVVAKAPNQNELVVATALKLTSNGSGRSSQT